MPSLSFVAGANVVVELGAEPVFCDVIAADDLTLDPASLERCITDATKAVIPMHYGGYPCSRGAARRDPVTTAWTRGRGRRPRDRRERPGRGRRCRVRHLGGGRLLQLLREQEPPARRRRHARDGDDGSAAPSAPAALARHDDGHLGAPQRPRELLRRHCARATTSASTSCGRPWDRCCWRSSTVERGARRAVAPLRRRYRRRIDGVIVPFSGRGEPGRSANHMAVVVLDGGRRSGRACERRSPGRNSDQLPLPADAHVHRVPRRSRRRAGHGRDRRPGC